MPTQSLVTFVTSVIAGAEVAVIAIAVHTSLVLAIISGIAGSAVNVLIFTRIETGVWDRVERDFPPKHPSPKTQFKGPAS
jgi:hypothetical protein